MAKVVRGVDDYKKEFLSMLMVLLFALTEPVNIHNWKASETDGR